MTFSLANRVRPGRHRHVAGTAGWVVTALAATLAVTGPTYAATDGGTGSAVMRDHWSWPLARAGLDAVFDPPKTTYGRGHRGVDIRAESGSTVRAAAPGRVLYVGTVGRVSVVTIDHGTTRSTYQPVRSRLRVGDAVERGDALGILLPAPSHCDTTCLHLGRVATDDSYLDPLDVLGGGRFRLIAPDGPAPEPPAASLGSGVRPVEGAVTSPFGMRRHPITGVRKLHDGTDFAAPCGTPVRATRSGKVASAGWDGPYGKRVMLDHGTATTGYAHLSELSVRAGQAVKAGSVIGRAGTTGLSTGCHLHLMALVGGKPVDPAAS